jgi:transcriptional regulator with PAS, ATPase and Fis domain
VILVGKDVLEPEDLRLSVAATPDRPASLNLEELEAWAITQAFRRHPNNVTQAARALGIGRDTLLNKMKKYGLTKGGQ